MVRIYRLESKDGKGMYRTDGMNFYSILDYAGLRPGDYYCHRSPSRDTKLGWNESDRNWFFGFANLDQYETWTINKKVRALLDVYGFVLQIYECSPQYTKTSDHQLVFIKEQAVLVDSVDPTEFDNFCN